MEKGISMEEALIVGLLFAVMYIYLILFAIGIANYIITSISLHSIASRRNIPNPWMAWIPVASNWIIGSIVDYHNDKKGIKNIWRKVLLCLSLIYVIGFAMIMVAIFIILFINVFNSADELSLYTIICIIAIYLLYFVVIVAAMAYQISTYICLYKIFEELAPKKAIKYILLSVLVPLASAFCLLKCKDSLNGIDFPVFTENTVNQPMIEPENKTDSFSENQ